MKSFREYLNESNDDLTRRIDNALNDEVISDLLMEDEKTHTEMLFEGGSSSESPFNLADASYYFADFDDQVDESDTTDTLISRREDSKQRTSQEVRDTAAQYKIVPDEKSAIGYTLMRKEGRFSKNRHEIDKKDILGPNGNDGILAQLNRAPIIADFEFEPDGTLTKDGKAITNPKSKKKWAMALNSVYQKVVNPDTVFRFQTIGTNKDGSEKTNGILLKNKTPLKQDVSNPNILDINSSEYEPIGDGDKEIIKKILDRAGSKAVKDTRKYDYDFDKKSFTIDGELIDKNEFDKLVRRLNGGVKQSDADSWNHFVFAKEGSKIGKHTGSFSLPPLHSCAKNVPCKSGCYAVKAYAIRPMVAAGLDNNLALLHEGKFEQFIHEAVQFINKVKLTHFRFSVSGDVYIGGKSSEYVNAIVEIAKQCGNTKFWLYTKCYDYFRGVSIPENLTVIMSAWGDFVPPEDIANVKVDKDGKQSDEHKKFPVAFLYDPKDEDILKYCPTVEKEENDGGLRLCPCTVANAKRVTCEECKICFTDLAYNNLGFKKH